MMRKINFIADIESFWLIRDEVGIGRIVALDDDEAGMLAPHIPESADTLYVACSGVGIAGEEGVFSDGEIQVAFEWVRHEKKPAPNEPECNAYRYLFGITQDGRCIGIDVTKPHSSDTNGQVADHWTTLDDVVGRHFPDQA